MVHPKKEDSDSEYLQPFGPPTPGFISIPPVLNVPERLDKTGMMHLSEDAPLQQLFADYYSCTVQVFHDSLITWVGRYSSEVLMIEKWLAVCGLTLGDYIQHLRDGGTLDGLELWLSSWAM